MNKLNHLIYEHFAPGVLAVSAEKRHTYLREVRAEKMKITAAMRELSQQGAPWEYKAQALRRYQVQVVLLLDALEQYHHHADPAVKAFYTEASTILEELLIALEQHFPEYLAQDVFMPKGYVAQVVRQLEERFRDTEKYLCDRRVDRRLLELVIRPLNRQHLYITFGMVMYYRRLLLELRENVHPFITDLTERVHYTLHQYNFNSTDYFMYCTAQLRKKVSRLRTLQEKKGLLSWYEKELRNMNSHGVSLFPGRGGLREQMLTWLREEKYFLQTLLTTSES
ncbi:hypothetical protein DLD77_10510 [Chitinophaga alhagiae]|uniref:CHAD domain-containing protein n=1 Tax=Chitinophaga alhagiae TaxID=2203219 RepID=A0ABN5LWE1_9BACT|nr:hypothetical protein [Chitinophaga alhagiae]AWO02095.1 hypothetical protein DLD77_10510 [Chitinophaga alhagiae]